MEEKYKSFSTGKFMNWSDQVVTNYYPKTESRIAVITEDANEDNIKNAHQISLINLFAKLNQFSEIKSITIGPIENKNLSDFLYHIIQIGKNLDDKNCIAIKNQHALKINAGDIKYKLSKLLTDNNVFVFFKIGKIGLKRNSNYVIRKLEKCKDRDYYIIDSQGTTHYKGKKLIN